MRAHRRHKCQGRTRVAPLIFDTKGDIKVAAYNVLLFNDYISPVSSQMCGRI